jgi:hypothetical protein
VEKSVPPAGTTRHLAGRTLSERPRPREACTHEDERSRPWASCTYRSRIPNDRSAIEREGESTSRCNEASRPLAGEPGITTEAITLSLTSWRARSTSMRVPPARGPSRPRPATSSTSNLRRFIESGTASERSRRSASPSAPGPDAWTSTDPIVAEEPDERVFSQELGPTIDCPIVPVAVSIRDESDSPE